MRIVASVGPYLGCVHSLDQLLHISWGVQNRDLPVVNVHGLCPFQDVGINPLSAYVENLQVRDLRRPTTDELGDCRSEHHLLDAHVIDMSSKVRENVILWCDTENSCASQYCENIEVGSVEDVVEDPQRYPVSCGPGCFDHATSWGIYGWVGHKYSLWCPRWAWREDNVGSAVWAQPRDRRSLDRLHVLRNVLYHDGRQSKRLAVFFVHFVGDHQRRARVGEDEFVPLVGIVGIQRDCQRIAGVSQVYKLWKGVRSMGNLLSECVSLESYPPHPGKGGRNRRNDRAIDEILTETSPSLQYTKDND